MVQLEQRLHGSLLLGAKLLLMALLFAYVLIVNGAVPGVLSPTLGQAVWLAGFATSIAEAPVFSIFAYDIGIPNQTAIAFGLPGALVIAAGLKAGLTPPDAYALACMFWLTIAFWGTYALCRHFGCSVVYSALGTAIWLTFPIVWQHSGYSMLMIGISLIPTYYYSVLLVIYNNSRNVIVYFAFFIFCILSSFMDGYSFIMFASISFSIILYNIAVENKSLINKFNYTYIIICFIISYELYISYSPSSQFKYSMEAFRGWGLDIAFIMTPAEGILWFPDLIGQSTPRNPLKLFGDSSVYRTTFSIVPILLATAFLFSRFGDKKYKYFMFAVAIGSLYLALGPSFKFNAQLPEGMPRGGMPREYGLGSTGTSFLWKYVPGLNNMRAVYRWIALALLGFWVVIMLALADRRLPRLVGYAALSLLAVYNIPHLEKRWDSYSRARTGFLQMEADLVRELSPVLKAGDTVAFLPAGNDFLINFLAPRLGIRTYNIGGDKNVALAREHWPQIVRATSDAGDPDAFAVGTFEVLNGAADVVAVPYIDLLMAAHRWPYPRNRFEEMQATISALGALDAFDIAETEYFAVVRLKPDIAALPVEARRNLIVPTGCPVGPLGGKRVELAQGLPLPFSDAGNLCGEGWSVVEEWGRWTDGNQAKLHFDLPTPAEGEVLELAAMSYVSGSPPSQRAGVRVNGQDAPEWVFTRDAPRQIVSIAIPDGATEITVEFTFPDARSPMQAGQSEDARVLGIGVGAVCLTPAGEACLTQ